MHQPKDAQMPRDQLHHEMPRKDEYYGIATQRPRVARPKKNTTGQSESHPLRVVCAPGGFAFVGDGVVTHNT